MKVAFKLEFLIDGEVVESGGYEISGKNRTILRESLLMALKKYEDISLDDLTKKIDKAK
jgi:hypothetical protein